MNWPDDTAAKERSRRECWAFPVMGRVIHPKYGEIIVPAKSPFCAILCAAEKWGCDWTKISDAQVWAITK